MYADPRFIRNRRVNLSLNEVEQRLIDAHAEYNGMQPSVFIRELVLEALARHESNSQDNAQEMRRAHS